jgi:hypothetical protein
MELGQHTTAERGSNDPRLVTPPSLSIVMAGLVRATQEHRIMQKSSLPSRQVLQRGDHEARTSRAMMAFCERDGGAQASLPALMALGIRKMIGRIAA